MQTMIITTAACNYKWINVTVIVKERETIMPTLIYTLIIGIFDRMAAGLKFI